MNLQDAVVLVFEDWRIRRGLTQMEMGQIIAPQSSDPKIAGQKWGHVVSGRKTTGKKRTLSLDELSDLADFFGVSPETVIIEARIKANARMPQPVETLIATA